MSALAGRRRVRSALGNPVARTAFGLYAVQAAAVLLPLMTLPYLARVLGPANIGILLFSQAFASLLTPLLGFGFELSASRHIARAPDDRDRVREIVSRVVAGKVLLAVASAAVAALVGLAVPLFRENPEYLLLAWLLGVLQGFSPLWYFLGRERIGVQASLDGGSKMLAAAGVFVWVQQPDDGATVLLLQVIAAALSVTVAHSVVYRQTRFTRPPLRLILQTLREGFAVALYRNTAIMRQTAPVLLIGVVASPAQTGYYGVADKLYKVPIAGLWPLTQALYPRVNYLLARNPSGAVALVRSTLVFFLAAGLVCVGLLAALAPWLIPFLFGPGFESSVGVFRLLVLAVPFWLIAHILTYQVLLPLGRDRAVAALAWGAIAVSITVGPPLGATFGAMGMAGAVLIATVLYAGGNIFFFAKETPRLRELRAMPVAQGQAG